MMKEKTEGGGMKMDTRIIGLAIAFVLIVAMAPIAMSEETAEGTTTVGNATPSVTQVQITELGDTPVSTLDPWTYYKVKVTVSDANTLGDIDDVVVKMYTTAAGEGGSDNEVNHYTFKYDATTTTWSEIGPDGTEPYDHLDTVGCEAPTPLTGESGTYVFKVRLAKVAEPSSSSGWTTKGIATDNDAASGDNTTTFDVNEYISLTIDDSTLTFSGAPGDTNVAPTEQPTLCTISTNSNFDIDVKVSGDWAGATHGGSIPAANTKAAQDGSHTGEISLSMTYQTLWSNVDFGESVEKDIYWFLNIPSPQRDDSYTTTVYAQAVKTT